MRRKIFVVNGKLAVGAAGSVLHIRRFLDDLVSEFATRPAFTYAQLKGFLSQYESRQDGKTILAEIGAVILAEATDWRGSLTSGLANQTNFVSDRFGRVIAIGTGATTIAEQVQLLDRKYQYGFSQPSDGGAEFPEFTTLANNLMLLANVYWNEFASTNNIFDAWGGAYDLIYQGADNQFTYLDQYTLFLRFYDIDHADQGIQLANVLKYRRQSEVSYIAMLNNGQLDFFGAKDITASDEPSQFEVGGPDFTMNSRVHVSIIAVGKEGRFAPPLIQIDGLGSAKQAKQTVFTWFDEDRRLCVAFNKAHDEWLTAEAKAYFDRFADKWS